ncbi:hypothetical protein Bca4012_101863 [Brassica carinata]
MEWEKDESMVTRKEMSQWYRSSSASSSKLENEEEQAVERIDGDGGVRVPSLVELTVVGSVKGGDEALQERIRHPSPTGNVQDNQTVIRKWKTDTKNARENKTETGECSTTRCTLTFSIFMCFRDQLKMGKLMFNFRICIAQEDVRASPTSAANDGLDCSLSELKKKKSVEPNSLNEVSLAAVEDLDVDFLTTKRNKSQMSFPRVNSTLEPVSSSLDRLLDVLFDL